jgi:hypothetical protein
MPEDIRIAFQAAAAEATEKWRHALAEAGKNVSKMSVEVKVTNARLICRLRTKSFWCTITHSVLQIQLWYLISFFPPVATHFTHQKRRTSPQFLPLYFFMRALNPY